jgi:ribosomal protein S18 acetylase RimI-like enzyme
MSDEITDKKDTERIKVRQDFFDETQSLVNVREANPNDAPGIYEVLKAAFLDLNVINYSKRAIAAAITKPWKIKERIISDQPVLVASFSERIVGSVSGDIQHMSMKVESFAVHPDFQGQGIGRQLLRALEGLAIGNGCYKVYLFTAWSMKAAARLYSMLGYEKEGYLRNQFYGEDLVVFGKCIDNEGEFKWNISEQTLQIEHSITRFWLY